MKKECFLPNIHPFHSRKLHFQQFNYFNKPFKKNIYGIWEPGLPLSESISIWTLDIIIMPLTGFDLSGYRIGMGGGFYDNTLRYCQLGNARNPFLLGIAYECQSTDNLPRDDWDMRLSGVATDARFIEF